jgi:hypothetical protein
MRNLFSKPVTLSRGAMVVAIVALCVAVTGGAYAANNIGKGAVQGKNIANGAVSAKKLAKGTIAKKVKFTTVTGPGVTVSGTESKAVNVTCPNGTQAVSGGPELLAPANSGNAAAIISSFRSSNTRIWTIRLESYSGGAKSFGTSAVCVSLG